MTDKAELPLTFNGMVIGTVSVTGAPGSIEKVPNGIVVKPGTYTISDPRFTHNPSEFHILTEMSISKIIKNNP